MSGWWSQPELSKPKTDGYYKSMNKQNIAFNSCHERTGQY